MQAKLTQAQTAVLMGMSVSGYRKWEQGTRRVSGPAEVAGRVANGLRTEGVAVKGLVVRDGVDRVGLRLVLEAANERFPHFLVGARGVVAFAGRAGTPVVLGVGGSGDIWVSERLGLQGLGGAAELTRRLLRAARVGA